MANREECEKSTDLADAITILYSYRCVQILNWESCSEKQLIYVDEKSKNVKR